jgi:magnesium transporter
VESRRKRNPAGSEEAQAGSRGLPPRAHKRSRHRKGHRPPVGERPGALSIPTGAAPPVVRAIRYDANSLREEEVKDVETLPVWRELGGVLWVDVEGFGDERVLKRIGEIFEIHPLALADAVNVPQRPKVEEHGAHYLIVARQALCGPDGAVELEQVSFVLGSGWVVSFQEERVGDVFDPIRARLRSGVGAIRRLGADYLVYSLLDAIVDGYFPVVETLGEEIDRIEEEVLGKSTSSTLHRIHGVRRLLLALHRVQWQQRDALGALLRDETPFFGAAVRPYLRDLHDHAVQVLDIIETWREFCVGLTELYLSTVSNRMNETIKTLTVMASIFIPLTFIVGIYGMNFEHMPELSSRWGYPAVWGVMLGTVGVLLLYFWRRGWISSRGD